jgi:hypothetical protein
MRAILLLLLVFCVQSRAETLPRRLDFGWELAAPAPGAGRIAVRQAGSVLSPAAAP